MQRIRFASCQVFTWNKTELKRHRKCKLLYMKRSRATLFVNKYDPGAAQASMNVKDLRLGYKKTFVYGM